MANSNEVFILNDIYSRESFPEVFNLLCPEKSEKSLSLIMISINFIYSKIWSQIVPWSTGCKMTGASLTDSKTLLISSNSIRVLGWSCILKGICLFFLWDYISPCYPRYPWIPWISYPLSLCGVGVGGMHHQAGVIFLSNSYRQQHIL